MNGARCLQSAIILGVGGLWMAAASSAAAQTPAGASGDPAAPGADQAWPPNDAGPVAPPPVAAPQVAAPQVAAPQVAAGEPATTQTSQTPQRSSGDAQIAPAAPAVATDVPTSLEEIIVTARKREERLQDVPEAVSALSAQDIVRNNIRDLRDVQELVPNLVIDPVPAQANGAAIYIRGFGVQDIDRTYTPAVSVVLDGLTIGSSTSGQLFNVYDLERIEVLRGPQGTLFGANSIGGVINLTRPRPSGKFDGEITGTFGSYSRHDFKGYLDFPIVGDVLSGRIAFASLNDDGPFVNDFNGKGRGFKDFGAFNAAVRYNKNDLDAQLTFDYIRDRGDWGVLLNLSDPTELLCQGALTGGVKECGPPHDLTHVNQNTPTFLKKDYYIVNLTANYRVNDNLLLTSITGFQSDDEDKLTDFDGVKESVFASRQPVANSTFSQELRATSSLGDLKLTSGLYYNNDIYQDDANSFFIFSLLGLPPGIIEIVDKHLETNNVGAYAQGDYDFTDQLTGTFGYRYTWEKKAFVYHDGFNFTGGVYPNTGPYNITAAGHAIFRQGTPRVGLSYKFTPDVLGYLYYAQGFKSGSFNGRGNSQDTIGPYRPETVDTYEVGAKSQFFDNRLRFNVAAFYNDYQDKQEEVVQRNQFTGATITQTVNAGAATSMGFETEGEVVPFEGLTIRAATGYLYSRYDRFITFDTSTNQNIDVANAVHLRRAPHWTATFSPEYRREVGDGVASVNATFKWTSTYDTAIGPRNGAPSAAFLWNDPRGKVGDKGILNLSTSYETDYSNIGLRATAFVRNVTDETYVTGDQPISVLFNLGAPAEGRTWGIELSAKF